MRRENGHGGRILAGHSAEYLPGGATLRAAGNSGRKGERGVVPAEFFSPAGTESWPVNGLPASARPL
jgi:hypothetical protein